MTPAGIRFAADGMLQSLARWLQLLGYDCLAGDRLFGRTLMERATVEARVFLTRNAHLNDTLPHALLARAQILFVVAEHLPEQLREVVRKFDLDVEKFQFTRCVECNEPLSPLALNEVADRIPADVVAREREFWQCAACGRAFWRGSHVHNSVMRLHRWLAVPFSG